MRVVAVVTALKTGNGIAEWVLNYYSRLAEEYNVEVSIVVETGKVEIEKKQISQKIKLVKLPDPKRHLIKYFNEWLRLKNELGVQFDLIHFHTDKFTKFLPFWLLRKQRQIVVHSHNSYNGYVMANPIKRLAHGIGKKIVKHSNFTRAACSDSAAYWLYGNEPFIQINNGVNTSALRFDAETRLDYQTQLGLANHRVYGHVGRFEYQKNHEKLISIFYQITKQDPLARLVLIGRGPDRDKIEKKVKALGIEEYVLFLGLRHDVKELLNAIDTVIFPSRFEGLPISLIEAQANGIKVWYADSISKQVEILPSIRKFHLNEDSKKIAERVDRDQTPSDRTAACQIVKDKGFDEKDVALDLYGLYENLLNTVQ